MFIVFEGIDGAGTTTQCGLLSEWFQNRNLPFHWTWEPSHGKIGRVIREYLSGAVDIPDVDRHFHALALLFAADRLDHLAREVEPHLKSGAQVISDRYLLSSLVYQSLHCRPEWIQAINSEAIAPHITFLIDLPVDMAMERLARRSLFAKTEIYETEDQLTRLRDLYLKTAGELYSDQEIIIIDGQAEPAEVNARVISQLEPRLQRHLEAQPE